MVIEMLTRFFSTDSLAPRRLLTFIYTRGSGSGGGREGLELELEVVDPDGRPA